MHKFKSAIINPIYLANNNEKISNQCVTKNNRISKILNSNDLISIRMNRSFKSKKIRNLISNDETNLEPVKINKQNVIQHINITSEKHEHTSINNLLAHKQSDKQQTTVRKEKIEDDELDKGNMSVMLQKAEEFIKNSLDKSQTEFEETKFENKLNQRSNEESRVFNKADIFVQDDLLPETAEQISEMLKSAEIFIKNSLDFNSKLKMKRTTSRRISKKLKNSALPVVNYSRLVRPLKKYEKNKSYLLTNSIGT
jgi:hypothetical protein